MFFYKSKLSVLISLRIIYAINLGYTYIIYRVSSL